MSEIDAVGMSPVKRLAVVVAFATLCGAIFSFLWTNSGGKVPLVGGGYQVTVDLPQVANIVYFSDVMVAGVKVGKVVEVVERGDSARVVMELDESVTPLHTGATVQVGAKSLVEESFLEITDGDGAELPSDSLLPPGSGHAATQLDDVFKSLDAPTRASLQRVLRALGAGTAGNKEAIAAAVRGLGDLGREGRTVLDALAAQSGDLEGMTRSATRILTVLSDRRLQLSSMVSDANDLMAVTAGQQEDLSEVMQALPPLMTTARESSDDIRRLSRALSPVARNLTIAAPYLTTALRELPATTRDLRATVPVLSTVLDRAPSTLELVPALAADIDGLVPPASEVLADANPMLGYLAPYHRDLAGFFANFAQTLALGDVNGKAFRVMTVVNEQSYNGWPFSTNIGPLDRFNPLPGPGSLDDPAPWGGDNYERVERGD